MAETPQTTPKAETASTSHRKVECDPCSTTDSVKEASLYCVQCKEYFCNDCIAYHRKFAVLKDHKIIDKKDVTIEGPEPRTTENHKLSWKECELHNGNCIEKFCSTHSALCCSLCIKENHSACEADKIEVAAQGFVGSDLYRNIAEKSSALKNKIKDLEQKYTQAETYLNEYATQSKCKSKNIASKILENILETKGNTLQNELIQSMNRSKNELKTMTEDVQRFQVSMDSKTYFEDELFVISHRQNAKMSKFSNYINTCIKNLPSPWIVQINPTKEEILSKCIDFKRTTKTDFVVKRKDEADCVITSIESLADGRFILADKANKSLKVFKRNNGFDFSEDIGGEPLVVIEVEPGKIAVLMSDPKVIQFYNVTDKFEKLNRIDLNDTPTGMSAFEQTIYVSFRSNISIIKNYGDLHERISKNVKGEDLFSDISCILVHKNLKLLYLINSNKLVAIPLKCIRQHGNNSNSIYGSGYAFKPSMTVFDDTSFFVCFENHVKHVTPDLKEIQSYSYKDFITPIFQREVRENRSYITKYSPNGLCCISYNSSLGRMYIGGTSNRICVIQLG